jgi:hypothetical protein
MPSIFNPSGVRKDTNERVVQKGSTYSFPDAYSGHFEFFKNRPIEIVVEEDEKPAFGGDDPVFPLVILTEDEPKAKPRAGFTFWRRR